METSSIETKVLEWFENRKRGNADAEREHINKNIQGDDYRMVEDRYMPFFGNPKAKLVYCNLNPGSAKFTEGRETNHHKQFLNQYEKCLSSNTANDLTAFLRHYGDFASNHFNMRFDRKQLIFLYGFSEIAKKNSVDAGMGFQGGADLDESGLREIVRNKANQRNLFNNRLQLELIPYASNKFDTKRIEHVILSEYWERLLKEVFSAPRSFVLLQGGVYLDLLQSTRGAERISEDKIDIANAQAQVLIYRITRNAQVLTFIVAPTFQGRNVQSYMGGYQYGKFCADAIFKNVHF